MNLLHYDSFDDDIFVNAMKYRSDLNAYISGFESVYVDVDGEVLSYIYD